MSAGTLTLTNNSAAVGGSGTAFTTELAAGDFILVTVGGVPYTLPVKTVNSNTSLTLVSNFTGPTQSGSAWSAIPRVAMNLVTAALVAQSAEALRGLNYDKQNWQQVFSGTGTITVKLPDGSTYTGPAWGSVISSIAGKAAKGANSDITELNGLTKLITMTQGGLGANTPSGGRTALQLKSASLSDVIGSVAGGAAIIERGSTSSGDFLKFADGTMIAWFNRGTIGATSQARTEGGMTFQWLAYNWVLPASFADVSKMAFSITTSAWGNNDGSGNSSVMTGSSVSALTTTSVAARIYASQPFASLSPLCLIMIGTWK